MICEAWSQLSQQGKAKYALDIVGHSGESAEIPFVTVDALPSNAGERWKIVEKMALTTQCVFSLSPVQPCCSSRGLCLRSHAANRGPFSS